MSPYDFYSLKFHESKEIAVRVHPKLHLKRAHIQWIFVCIAIVKVVIFVAIWIDSFFRILFCIYLKQANQYRLAWSYSFIQLVCVDLFSLRLYSLYISTNKHAYTPHTIPLVLYLFREWLINVIPFECIIPMFVSQKSQLQAAIEAINAKKEAREGQVFDWCFDC